MTMLVRVESDLDRERMKALTGLRSDRFILACLMGTSAEEIR